MKSVATDSALDRILLRNSLLNFFGQATPLVVGMLALPFLVRGLGTDRFGIFSLALVVIGHWGLFDLGLGRAITRFVAEHLARDAADEVPALVWTSATVQVVFGLLGALLFAAVSPLLVQNFLNIPAPLRREAETTCYLLALSIPLVAVSTSFRGLLEGVQRFDLVNAVATPSAVATFLLPLAGLLLGLSLPGIVASLVALRLLGLLVMVGASVAAFPKLRAAVVFRPAVVFRLLTFGGWITVSSVAAAVLVYSDRFLIGSLQSMSMVAYYTAPYDLVTRLWIIPSSMLLALFPAASTLHSANDRHRLKELFTDAVRYLALILLPVVIALVVFAREILDAWLGAAFATHGTTVMRLLAVGVLVNSLAQLPSLMLQASGRPDIPAKLHLLEVPIHWVAVWWLVRDLGIVGAAWAWLFRVSLDASLLFVASLGMGRLYARRV